MENVFGLVGLALVVFAVAVWKLGPDWGALLHAGARHPACRRARDCPTYCYYAIALFGAAMTPYEVFFFSSGGVEEKWTREGPRRPCAPTSSSASRSAALLSLAIVAVRRRGVPAASASQVEHARRRSALPVAVALGKVGLAFVLARVLRRDVRRRLRDRPVGRATASRSTSAGSGASSCAPLRAARFHAVVLLSTVLAGVAVAADDASTRSKVTEYSVVFSARRAAADLLADPRRRERPRRTWASTSTAGSPTRSARVYLVVIVVVAVAAIPLMIVTKAGQ